MADTLAESGPGNPELIDEAKCRAIAEAILKRYEDSGESLDHNAIARDLRIELYPHLKAAGPYAAQAFVGPIIKEFGKRRAEAHRMEEIAFMTVGPDELGDPVGATHRCPNCGELHDVINSDILHAIKCPRSGDLYLVGIRGQVINKRS